MRAEEVKLERLRQRIEDHDWKLIRGQLSIHEHEIANEFKDLDGDSSDESIAVVPETGLGKPCPQAEASTGWVSTRCVCSTAFILGSMQCSCMCSAYRQIHGALRKATSTTR